jgi:hypothetical protein
MASTTAARFSDSSFAISSVESSNLQLLSESNPDLSDSCDLRNLFWRDTREALEVLRQMALTRKANL